MSSLSFRTRPYSLFLWTCRAAEPSRISQFLFLPLDLPFLHYFSFAAVSQGFAPSSPLYHHKTGILPLFV